MTKDRFQAKLASYVMLIKDGKILLGRRFNTGYEDGNYGLPSGHIEEGESPEDCAVRETEEEIGIKVDDLEFVTVIYNTLGNWGYYVDFFFITDKYQGVIKNLEQDKCDDLSWFPLNELPKNIVPEVKMAIENYSKKTYYSKI